MLALGVAMLLAQAGGASSPGTVTKAGKTASSAVGVQGVTGGIPLDVNATVTIGAVTATNPSVGATDATAPTSTTQIGGVDAGGVLRVPYVMTSTPSGSEPGLVVRMPSGAAGLTNTELRAAPVAVGASQSGTWSGVGVTGPLTNTELRAAPVSTSSTIIGTVPVSGTFYQATQPVSIASMPSTPVTGTFWQATQPVSGTFWQATQPVSGTVAATLTGQSVTSTISGTVTVTGPLTDTQLRATAVPVSLASVPSHVVTGPLTNSELRGAGNPIYVSVTSTTITGTVAATQSGSWSLAANQSVNVAQINGVTPLMGAGNTGTGSPRVTIASDQAAIPVTFTGQSVTSTDALAQGATTSGQRGNLIFAATATSSPTLVGATSNPLSTAPNGYLRASELSDLTTSATSTTATAATQWIAASGTNKVYIKFAQCSSSAASSTTTNEQCQLIYGTGTNCGTGTTLLAACFTPATGGCNWHDLVAPASSAICFRHAVAGTKLYVISYRQAP